MSTTKTKEKRLCQMFDSYCNKVIDCAILYFHKRGAIQNKRELITAPEEILASSGTEDYDKLWILEDGLYYDVVDDILHMALLTLPKKQLKVLILDFWYAKKNYEIADYMEVNVRMVYNLKQRAYKTIKRYYEKRSP